LWDTVKINLATVIVDDLASLSKKAEGLTKRRGDLNANGSNLLDTLFKDAVRRRVRDLILSEQAQSTPSINLLTINAAS
jgi:hypothetical protein